MTAELYTRERCIDMILETFRTDSLPVVLAAHVGLLGADRTVEEHMETEEGRCNVYHWALGLAEGVMG